jgi:hypothetical protein
MAFFDVTLTPAQVEIVAKPGTLITQVFTVTNNSDNTIYLTPSVSVWQPNGPSGLITYIDVPKNPYFDFSLLNSDIYLNKPFVLEAHSTQQVVLKAKSNPETPLGDAYHTLFLTQTLGETNDVSSSPSTVARIGSHFLVSISNSESPTVQSKVIAFHASPVVKDIFLTPIRFDGQITNLTDYFFKINGNLTITKNNLVIAKIPLSPDNILANHSRSVTCLKNDTPIPCVLNPPLWPGKYTATLSLDPSMNTQNASFDFFVFPFSFVLLASLVALLGLFVWRQSRTLSKTK